MAKLTRDEATVLAIMCTGVLAHYVPFERATPGYWTFAGKKKQLVMCSLIGKAAVRTYEHLKGRVADISPTGRVLLAQYEKEHPRGQVRREQAR